MGLGRSVSEVTWCCRPRAGETVLSYKSCPLPSAPFCCWFLFCFEDWTLHYIDSFHPVTATELAKLLERENKQTLLGRVRAKSRSGNSKTGQSPGGPARSAHCLDPTPVPEGKLALFVAWSLVSPCQVKVRKHLCLSGPLVVVLGKLLVRCPLR